jgi:ATP-dependent protease ClpP protease subunit
VGAPQTYRYLRDMQDRIADFVCRNSRIDKKRLEELMMKPDALATDVGTIVDGREAVEVGLIDEVGGLADALAALRGMREG